MTSKIKAPGLAFVVILATSAIAASAAHAGSLDVGTSPAVFSGIDLTESDSTLVLQKTNGTPFPTVCQQSTIAGTTQGQQVSEATGTATYSGVCQFLSLNATVRLNGCKYTFQGAGQAARTARIDITGCTAAAPYISIQVTGCQLRIPEQTNLPSVVGTNLGEPHNGQVRVVASVSGITIHQVGLACPDGNDHTGTRAAFGGNTTISANADTGTQQAQEHNHQFAKPQLGDPVSITAK